MRLTRGMLDEAVSQQVLAAGQADALWQWLAVREAETPAFKPAHILYYLGGLIAIGAMTLFMTLGWEQFGGVGLMFISACYCLLAIALTEWFLRRKGLAIPAGITGALAVVMVPLAIYGLQHVLGLWADREGVDRSYRDFHVWIDWRWVVMEFATLIAGAVALWRYRLPFMVMPVAVTLWYMSMDLVPFLLGGSSAEIFSDQGKLISAVFGFFMLLFAFRVDLRAGRRRDFAFWLYLFGMLAFWGGLSSLNSNSELGKFVYCLVNLALIAIGAAISRRVFAVFGSLGVAGYLGHLSYSVFKDSLWFPVALTAIGFAVVAAGVVWQRHEAALGQRLRRWMPTALREALA
ncbi:hypothetical protein BH09PSE6_BH09PSE6_13030 [soil metagenome]